MAQDTVQIGDVREMELRTDVSPEDQTACHLRLRDASGRELTLQMNVRIARKIVGVMHRCVNVKD